ncbi:Acetyl-coenzyme A synthetase [Elsinoe australis]|uniref:Acetyl-coenzyme A synthetase n=1 Tax=Elsinoe australis TaxID=40998 RepID=A0A2P7ZDG1_9PEZI|nr:Acetyl-coenzyme A synthetase [Elsinoe australis]
MLPQHPQDITYEASISSPSTFWAGPASQLTWTTKPSTILKQTTKTLPSGASHPHWQWFPDGSLSTTYNCIDRHVHAGHGSRPAIIWDSPVSSPPQKTVLTYSQLQEEVAILAGVLREEDVKKGDVVLVYMPMIPAALIGILATAQLGAIHAVVFGGFSAGSLAQRIEASGAVAVLTASCGIEGAKGPLSYRPMVQEAVRVSKHKPAKVLVWQREELRWDPVRKEEGERNWQRLVKSARNRGLRAEPVSTSGEDPLYIIYTSGTTGTPKGVLRHAVGHAVLLNHSMRYLFGIRPGDVMFCASDIGWVVGHSYILYAPLLAGATTVLFEGKPVGTPNADTFWRILEENKVNVLFTAPTALRAIRKDDPNNEFFSKRGGRGGLRNLRALFLAGERSEPAIVSMYQELLGKYGASGANVVDNWWSSESGSPISGLAQLPAVGQDFESTEQVVPFKIKPGSAGKPMPGFNVRVVDDDGNEVKQGEIGNIVLGIPLAPTGLTTLWNDEERFYKSYMKRFDGKWIDTGDAGIIDEDGYVHIMARTDDIINVAAHRLSTGSIEQAIGSHPSITEVAVVPIPDHMKGHMPFAFVASSSPVDSLSPPGLLKDVNQRIRQQIGGIAVLGGIIVAPGTIPKTRSGKTLRRVLRELLDNAFKGEFDKQVNVPATVEDASVVENARKVVKQYFENGQGKELKAKL